MKNNHPALIPKPAERGPRDARWESRPQSSPGNARRSAQVLVIDIGGTNVKLWITGSRQCVKFPSGKKFTPAKLMNRVDRIAGSWNFDRVSLGYPGNVIHGRPLEEAENLGPGWNDFDWWAAFDRPLRIMNDASMQALGSYEGGRMLFIGLGTGVGTTFVTDGKILPLALGYLPFREGKCFDDFLAERGLEEHGLRVWREATLDAAQLFKAAFLADYVVFGGGNAKKLKNLPKDFRRGGNHNAYFGGLRMWDDGFALEMT